MTDHRHPRALLVEDDPVSAAFLEAALARVPLHVDVAHDCATARRMASAARHDLWVIDANLPDGRGDALLRELRESGAMTAALAHTAAREAEEHERLLASGFLEVLVKPLSTSEIVGAARMALGRDARVRRGVIPTGAPPLWDDAAALDALLGERAHLVALRGLFRPELVALRDSLRMAVDTGDAQALRSQLHRLRASCGFVGAARLSDATAVFATRGREGWPEFQAVLDATLDQFP